jgi:hypothetical protein
MNEFPPDEAQQEITRQPPSIEGGAIAAGCAAGCVMYALRSVATTLLVGGMFTSFGAAQRLPNGMAFWIILQFCFEGAAGAVVGFVTAQRAQHRKMRHAALVVGVISFLETVPMLFMLGDDVSHVPLWSLAWMLGRIVIFLLAALYGAYMAQSFARNRGVKIE